MSFVWGPLSGGAHLLLTPAASSTGYHYYNLLRRRRMSRFWQSEGTAARRRFHLYLVDATDGLTPETGEAGGQPQISKNGGAFSNTSATLTSVGNGAYYVELTATELDTLGGIMVRYKSANTAEFNGEARVELQPLSPTTAGRTLDVSTTGEAGIDWANIGGPTTSQTLSGTTIGTATALGANSVSAAALATDAVAEIAAAISIPSAASVADAVWDEAISGHLTSGSTGEALSGATAPTAAAIADAVLDEALSGHVTAGTAGAVLSQAATLTLNDIADAVWDETLADHVIAGSTGEALDAAGDVGITVDSIVDGVWDAVAADHDTAGTMGANLQTLADAVLVWPTPVGGGTTASEIIRRAMALSDMHDNFVTEDEWLSWLNQEHYALKLFLARHGWQLPFDTTTATINADGWTLATDGGSATQVDKTTLGHYVFTPTEADIMALVCVHQVVSGTVRLLKYTDNVSFLKQNIGATLASGHATEYRCRMYGNEIHMDFFPAPATGETYLITFIHVPTPLTATTQSVALPMGWEERLVLGMARRALIKEESDAGKLEQMIREMDSQIEQLCWNRVMSESPKVRNADYEPPPWQYWYWRA